MRKGEARRILNRLLTLERKAETAMRIISVVVECDSRGNHRGKVTIQTGKKISSVAKRYSARTFEGLQDLVRRDFNNRPNDVFVFVKRSRDLEEDTNTYEN